MIKKKEELTDGFDENIKLTSCKTHLMHYLEITIEHPIISLSNHGSHSKVEMTEEMSVAPNERRIQVPEPTTLIIAAAVAGGAVAAGLVMYYYLRKRRDERMAH